MQALHKVLAFAVLGVSAQGHAADQGQLSTTSSQGMMTVTANGPATPRAVQVLGISDPTFNNSSRGQTTSNVAGVVMTFCVVDTYGGATNLQVASTNGADNATGWKLAATTADFVTYTSKVFSPVNGGQWGLSTNNSNSYVAVIPAGVAAASSAACGTGNIRMEILLAGTGFMPETFPTRSYTDVLTLTLTPQ